MKTFNDLKLGDKIYFVKKGELLDIKDKYGNCYESKFLNEIKVSYLNDADGVIYVNRFDRYHSTDYLLKVSNDKKTEFTKDNNTYFADKSLYENVVRNIVRAEVESIKEKLKSFQKSSEDRIESIRKKYKYYLN
jgi:hypothetical protein